MDRNTDLAVHARAKKAVVAHSKEIGVETKHMKEEIIYEMMAVYMGRIDKPFLYPLNALQWTDKMQSEDPMGDVAKVDYLVMTHTTSLMLRGLSEMLGQPRNLASEWAPFARQALQQKGKLEEVEKEIASWTA